MNLQKKLRLLLPCICLLLLSNVLTAQDVMMQGWYWDYPKTAQGHNWADTLNQRAAHLGQAGFTYLWLPPLSRASFGSGSNGYDPQDLYDLGDPAVGATGFGTRADVDQVIATLQTNGVKAVADVVYNHRDGGKAEDNPAVEGWIENLNCTKVNSGDNAFPSDRYRCYLPLGGTTGNGAKTYYFKIRSASTHPNYYNRSYKVYMETNTVGFQNLPALDENEIAGNGGGDCGQGNTILKLGVDMNASIDDIGTCGGACGIDEFQLTIQNSDFNAAGDTIWIYMSNSNGNYSDHFIAGIWDGTQDIQSQVGYQTYTDFTNMPSGRGGMDYTYFKPNGNPTQLNGDFDWMWFFYDYDQTNVQKTIDTLNVWSKWLWEDVGIRGFRMDAVKHFSPEFTGDLMDYLHDEGIDPGMVVGEFFDGNPSILNNWVNAVQASMDSDTKAAIDMRVFDFSIRNALKDACDNPGADVRGVFNSGLVNGVGASSNNVVTFVNNHDFRDAGQPVQNDPMLAYTYLLTNNQIGLPCVYYPDYFGDVIPNAPVLNLKAEIDALLALHKNYIFQSNAVDYLNQFGNGYTSNFLSGSTDKTLLYQLSGGIGGKEVIVAINFSNDILKVDHGVNMTNLSVGDTLYDALGNSNFPFAIISNSFANAANEIYVELPPKSYSVWINASEAALLPLTLGQFQATAKEDFVRLDWTSYDEVDFAGFEIQRSLDGQRFEPIGWQAGTQQIRYQYDDLTAVFGRPLYYRLKLLDLDGKFEYTEVQTVRLAKDLTDFQVAPNPARDQITMSINSSLTEMVEIELLNLQGKRVRKLDFQLSKGNQTLDLNIEDLPTGVYWIQLNSEQGFKALQLVKY